MKGGRALNGTLVRSELRVKWAPEVYDPPATSMSQTMTGHQRPKANKKDKHKHKGKSSRGNGSERSMGTKKVLARHLIPRMSGIFDANMFLLYVHTFRCAALWLVLRCNKGYNKSTLLCGQVARK